MEGGRGGEGRSDTAHRRDITVPSLEHAEGSDGPGQVQCKGLHCSIQ